MRKLLVYIFTILISFSCSRNHHSYISTSSLQQNEWYKFKDFNFKGELSNGFPSGFGIVQYPNGVEIKGNFRNGVLNDQRAYYKIPDIGTIVGYASSGKLVSGEVRYENGNYYRGNLDSYLPSGNGLLVERNGDISTGTFRSGYLSEGSKFDNNSKATMIGSFLKGKPDGEITQINKSGEITAAIYANGQDQTQTKIATLSSESLRNANDAELNPFNIKIKIIENKLKQEDINFKNEKSKLEKPYSNMEGVREKHFSQPPQRDENNQDMGEYGRSSYLVYNYNDYWRNFKGVGWKLMEIEDYGKHIPQDYWIWVKVERTSTFAEVKEAFVKKLKLLDEYLEWKNNKNNYQSKEKIEQLIVEHESYLAEEKEKLAEIDAQKRQLQIDQKNRYEQELKEKKITIATELNEKALKRAREREAQCKKSPSACGCITVELLQKCLDPKHACVSCQ